MKLSSRFNWMVASTAILIAFAIPAHKALAATPCGTARAVGPLGCDLQFGLSDRYDNGVTPSVAMISTGLIIEVHRSEHNTGLYYHVGKRNGLDITWGPSHQIDYSGGGYFPRVAMSSDGRVIVVHTDHSDSSGAQQYYQVGRVDPNGDVAQTIAWTATDVIRWDGGFRASISINSLGVIVGVHQTNNGNKRACYYRVGHLGADNKISWDSGNSGQPYTDCETPQIAINDRNQVVEVHNVPGAFKEHYIRGTVVGGVIQFPKDQPRFNDTGSYPSITLTNDGFVAELDWFNSGIEKRVGKLRAASADLIDWAAPSRINLPTDYPPRTNSALGTDGKYVVQVHEAGKDPLLGEAYLVSSVSAIRDRSNWMGDAMPEIGEKKLSQIVIPATHDSGMYCDGALSSFGQTQDETLYQQLEGGIRYFDLRVDSGTATVSPSNQQRIYHGGNFVTCETVGEAMKDVRKFMEEGHKEAIVLKFSHFNHFGSCKSGDYDKLKSIIVADLMPWMLTANGDPAQMRISDLVGDNGRVIAVIDKDWALPVCQEQSGFYVYRDWNSDDPQNGEFNVFDVYANTLNYNTLVKDQFQKFADYNGIMENRSSGEDKSQIQSDLFLLAWTLTPTTGVSEASLPASRGLAAKMSDLEENRNGFIPNLISVDYYERARVTDVSIEMLERLVH